MQHKFAKILFFVLNSGSESSNILSLRLGESKEQYTFNFISICHIFLLGLIWWWTFACFILENYLGVANLCGNLQIFFNNISSDQHSSYDLDFCTMSHQSSSYGCWSHSAGRLLFWVGLSAYEIKNAISIFNHNYQNKHTTLLCIWQVFFFFFGVFF